RARRRDASRHVSAGHSAASSTSIHPSHCCPTMPLSYRTLSLVTLLVCSAVTVQAQRTVFPPEAIEDAMHLPAEDFRRLNPGIDISATGLSDEGFYIRYIHENLVYYFGPMRTLEEAKAARDDMLAIRDRVVAKRPALENSKV